MHAQRLYQYAVTLYITDPRVLMHHRHAFEFQAVNVLGVDTLDAIIPPPQFFFHSYDTKEHLCAIFLQLVLLCQVRT